MSQKVSLSTSHWLHVHGLLPQLIPWSEASPDADRDLLSTEEPSDLFFCGGAILNICLVVTGTWLVYVSRNIGNVIIPIDALIFFRGVKPPTRNGRFWPYKLSNVGKTRVNHPWLGMVSIEYRTAISVMDVGIMFDWFTHIALPILWVVFERFAVQVQMNNDEHVYV